MKKKFLTLLLFLSMDSHALPEHVHFFFISPESVSLLEGFNESPFMFSKFTAQNTKVGGLDCVPMGDGCFNPQVGYVDDEENEVKKDADIKKLKTINAAEVDLINCVEGNYFDVFCGKSKTVASTKNKIEVEVWIDTSSSMRTVDYNKDPEYCERRVIARKFRDTCKEKVNIQIFDTSIKQLGEISSTCVNYGLNNQKRLIKWIASSNVKNLYIFTDIDELSLELKDYLDSISATIYGGDQKIYTMKDVQKEVDKTVAKYCK